MNRFILKLFPAAVLLLFLLLAGHQSVISEEMPPINSSNAQSIEDNSLPAVGSIANLKALIKKAYEQQRVEQEFGLRVGNSQRKMNDQAIVETAKSSLMGGGASNYSDTNVQVQGVDEADVVKTDGKYIYQVNNRQIIIAEVYPPEKMQIVKTLAFDDKNYFPQEIYVDEKYLVVIGNTHHRPGINSVKTLIYDITDKNNIVSVREVELEGYYLSSRKIGSALYLIANKYVDYYSIIEKGNEPVLPSYRDSLVTDSFTEIECPDIRYFPDSTSEPNYLIIAGLDLNKKDQEVQLSTFLGSGQNIYASQNNLYVAVTQYKSAVSLPQTDVKLKEGSSIQSPEIDRNTFIYKFSLNEGKTPYTGKGEVPGNILNQFSMDEYNGFLRITTTTGDMWRTGEHTSKNNLYVLNQDLTTVGKIEGIAPGERIYSTRFIGDRAYMVTFRTVDPLFVIDLKSPKAPKILGELKIPGYSDYLHPYDENHIIGFGKDTVEVTPKDRAGNEPMAFHLGMKIALFDVSDVSKPKEKFTEIIGDRGTESELLYNHKALLFDKERNLMAFPVTVTKVKNNKIDPWGVPAFGDVEFQGAYVYNITADGFALKGRITHLSQEELSKASREGLPMEKNIARILYINDELYTLSNSLIKVNQLSDLQEKNSLRLN